MKRAITRLRMMALGLPVARKNQLHHPVGSMIEVVMMIVVLMMVALIGHTESDRPEVDMFSIRARALPNMSLMSITGEGGEDKNGRGGSGRSGGPGRSGGSGRSGGRRRAP